MQKDALYQFDIVRSKYSRRKRALLGIITILFTVFGFPFLLAYTMAPEPIYFLFITLGVMLMYAILLTVVEKTNKIGILKVDNEKLILLTKNLKNEIPFDDIRNVKLRGETGIGKSTETMKTILVSITLYDGKEINIHSTREWFKNGIRQKTNMFTKNIDLWDILIKNNIKTSFDRKLREQDCINE